MPNLFSWLLPGGSNAKHITLNFHQVLQSDDPLRPGEMTTDRFNALMGLLARHFNVVPLEEALVLLQHDALPPASVSITFDDGYADNLYLAMPILERYGLSATFFIATDYLDGGRMWNDTILEVIRRIPSDNVPMQVPGVDEPLSLQGDDQRLALARKLITTLKYAEPSLREEAAAFLAERVDELPRNLMLTSSELRILAGRPGAAIGAHTATHPILARLTLEQAEKDIHQGRDELAEILGTAPPLFAYPNGRRGTDYSDDHATILRRAGFTAAVTTDYGTYRKDMDPFHVPRFAPWRESAAMTAVDLLRCRWGG